MLEILDVDGILILTSKFNKMYGREYSYISLDLQSVKKKIKSDNTTSIFTTNEHVVIYRHENDILVIFYASLYANEVFLNSMLNLYMESLRIATKKSELNSDVIDHKFDYVVLLTEYFVYDGMFMTETSEELIKKLPKRNFEDIKAMPVPKGFSSIFRKVKLFK